MNQLDASTAPVDIFRDTPNLEPYRAVLPSVAIDNLVAPPAHDAQTAYWMRRTSEQDLSHADMADARTLNEVVWFSIRGSGAPMPGIARLPAVDAMRTGAFESEDDEGELAEAEPHSMRSDR
jgi:hypothetical protein